jgi:hypothetical protein
MDSLHIPQAQLPTCLLGRHDLQRLPLSMAMCLKALLPVDDLFVAS